MKTETSLAATAARREAEDDMSEQIMTYHVTDGQGTWIYEDWATALEHIRQSFLSGIHPPQDGDEYHIELKPMSRAAYDALPEQ
jgi:hypothetical protein